MKTYRKSISCFRVSTTKYIHRTNFGNESKKLVKVQVSTILLNNRSNTLKDKTVKIKNAFLAERETLYGLSFLFSGG